MRRSARAADPTAAAPTEGAPVGVAPRAAESTLDGGAERGVERGAKAPSQSWRNRILMARANLACCLRAAEPASPATATSTFRSPTATWPATSLSERSLSRETMMALFCRSLACAVSRARSSSKAAKSPSRAPTLR
eukprot:scaffold144232_cov109-Phaeocystis_antarctica.AAC.1